MTVSDIYKVSNDMQTVTIIESGGATPSDPLRGVTHCRVKDIPEDLLDLCVTNLLVVGGILFLEVYSIEKVR